MANKNEYPAEDAEESFSPELANYMEIEDGFKIEMEVMKQELKEVKSTLQKLKNAQAKRMREDDSPAFSTRLAKKAKLEAEKECECSKDIATLEPEIWKAIENKVLVNCNNVSWDDIAGLSNVKDVIREVVELPLIRPDLFQGLRAPPKGILLYGPPGNGKSLIANCIASSTSATFLSVSASTLMSKWEGEKLVRALFLYARSHQPAIVFIDEIESLLKSRSENEDEPSRRRKAEFFIQLDSVRGSDKVLILAATNKPQDLDFSARRRFSRSLYVPLPDDNVRREILVHCMSRNSNNLCDEDFSKIANLTQGYSGADMTTLCSDAAMACIRELSREQLMNVEENSLRQMNVRDFLKSLKRVKPSISPDEIHKFAEYTQRS